MTDHAHQASPTFWLGFLAQTIHYALKQNPAHVKDILEPNLRMFTESKGCPTTLRKDLK